MLPAALPHTEGNPVDLALDQTDVNIGVPEVLGQCATGTLDSHKARLDGDFNTLWDFELFSLEDVPHLG